MYYNRTISKEFSSLLENKGDLKWLFDFVKHNKELDFLIGKNNSKQWISVYRGLSRILTITERRDKSETRIDAANAYKKLASSIYGVKLKSEKFQEKLENLIAQVEKTPKFDRYYKNRKEGYYQNELSRKFGICGGAIDDFVIVDKEAVIGYSNQMEKDELLGTIQQKYKQLQKDISIINPKRYGKNLEKKAIGNELDFLALDKEGNILLIEYKHGTNTAGIYLSPLQIGLYYDIFTNFPKKELEYSISEMINQKQEIGLINPKWVKPYRIKEIIPVLIISEHSYNSSAKTKFDEIFAIVRKKLGAHFLSNLQAYNFTMKDGLSKW